jgi:hypothetical protein
MKVRIRRKNKLISSRLCHTPPPHQFEALLSNGMDQQEPTTRITGQASPRTARPIHMSPKGMMA